DMARGAVECRAMTARHAGTALSSGLFGARHAPPAVALGRLDDAHALDTARIGVEHMELEAGYGLHHLAARRHAAQRVEDHAADRVDRLAMLAGGETAADHLRHLVDLGAAVNDVDAVAGLGDHRLLVVVLVLDVADNHLDDVLQRG